MFLGLKKLFNAKKQAEGRQYGRSERPENGDIAPLLWSDAYNKGTKARKEQARAPLYGRSMVEMLGVLAIIGVLSVGALEGYSRAMYKYKLNKMTDQVNLILSTIIRYQNDLKISDFSTGEYLLAPFLKKLNELPETMFGNNPNYIYDVFGNHYYIYHHSTNYIGIISKIDNSHEHAIDICRNFFMIAKNYHEEIWYTMIWDKRSTDPHNASKQIQVMGDKRCKNGVTCLKDLSINDADQRCKALTGSDNLLFYFTFE